MKRFLFLLFVISLSPLFAQASDDSSPRRGRKRAATPVESTGDENPAETAKPEEEKSTEKEKPGSTLLRLLEIAAVQGVREKGPETIASTLGSIRMVNSIQSGQTEVYKDKRQSGRAGSSPGIRYSHQFTDGGFIGISSARGIGIVDNRATIGSLGSVTNDRSEQTLTQSGIRIGAGPLNILAGSSTEFSIGYQEDYNHGPYTTMAYRRPSSVTSPIHFAFGTGFLKYRMKSYMLDFGFAGGGKYFGIYGKYGLYWSQGDMNLNSAAFDVSRGTMAVQEIHLLTFPMMNGLIYTAEIGFVIKPWEYTGIRVGGYYQVSSVWYKTAKGYSYINGQWTEVKSAVNITSVSQRHEDGSFGVSFGVVQKL